MALEDIERYFKFSREQKLDLFFTLILPLASGSIILIAIKPSTVTDTSFLTLCLLAFITIVPMWLINIILWNLFFFKAFRNIIKQALFLANLPKAYEYKYRGWIDEIVKFRDVQPVRYFSSIITVFSSYMAAGCAYFLNLLLPATYAILFSSSIAIAVLSHIVISQAIRRLKPDNLWSLAKVINPDLSDDKRQEIINKFKEARERMYQEEEQ
jgi:hypothetical protein